MSAKQVSKTIEVLWREQNGLCYLCLCEMSKLEVTAKNFRTIDHVIPLSRGGSNCRDNKRLACFSCNQAKGDKLPSEYEHSRRAGVLGRMKGTPRTFDFAKEGRVAVRIKKKKPIKKDVYKPVYITEWLYPKQRGIIEDEL